MDKVFREIKKEITFQNRAKLDFPAHIHDDIELVFVKRGGGTVYCDGKRYTLVKNGVFIAFPNQVHHYVGCEIGEYITLIIKPALLYSYGNVFEKCVPVSAVWQFENDKNDTVVFLINTALHEFEKDGYSPIIEAYLTALFGKLLNICELQKKRISHDIVLQMLQYCKDHYKEDITVGSVADSLHISRSSVSHIFSSRLSMNFCDYINSLRLTDAVEMLKNKNYSITEISYMCGFTTIRTFNRAFLKKYGVTPSAYKKM